MEEDLDPEGFKPYRSFLYPNLQNLTRITSQKAIKLFKVRNPSHPDLKSQKTPVARLADGGLAHR
jgi:hypothetical protein